MLEKTLVILKPDTVKRAIVGEIISRFEKVGLLLEAMKMVWVTEDLARKHYEWIGTMVTRYGEEIFQVTADYVRSGPVVAMVWEWVEAVAIVRKLIWATQPKEALPGTIRGDYAHVNMQYVNGKRGWLINLVHASATPEEAAQEIELWFNNEEIHDHEMIGQEFKRGHK